MDVAVSAPISFHPDPSGITVLVTFVTSYILSFMNGVEPKTIHNPT